MHKKADTYSSSTIPAAKAGAVSVGDEAAAAEMEQDVHALEELTQTHKFKNKVEFAQADPFGSRAVGGQKPSDEVLYGKIQSSDYLVPDTAAEEAYQRSFTPHMRNRRRLFVWVLYAWLGVSVAICILYTLGACDWILKKRVKATTKLLAKNDLTGAFIMWTGSSLVLCLGACAMVLWQPAAASSGIPALIAYLNGVIPLGGTSTLTGKKTGFRSWQTLLAKLVGMTLSIPSGLCLGPEGPIIHISALLGHHTTKVVQTLSHRVLPDHMQFTVKPGEGRDFLATGAACGICVAFRAPMAGCLFVVEEAASFFTTEHLEYTFFATIISYFVAFFLADPVRPTALVYLPRPFSATPYTETHRLPCPG
jgi:H+/Cl- antiporter ClcA